MGKLVSCSKCFKPVETKKTAVIEGLRVCHDCRKAAAKKPFDWGKVYCDYRGCGNAATTKGFVFVKSGEERTANVNACDHHKKLPSFFENKPIPVDGNKKPPYMDLDD